MIKYQVKYKQGEKVFSTEIMGESRKDVRKYFNDLSLELISIKEKQIGW